MLHKFKILQNSDLNRACWLPVHLPTEFMFSCKVYWINQGRALQVLGILHPKLRKGSTSVDNKKVLNHRAAM